MSYYVKRRRLNSAIIVAIATNAFLLAGFESADAQPASNSRSVESNVALEGYCPVCVVEMKKWVRGTSEHTVNYDGKTYAFPGAQQKQMFLADPAKYVPALGGDCTVCFAKMGKRMPGNIRFASLRKKRLYLFPSEDQRSEFRQHADQYANIDLAFGGNCAVCRVEAKKDVAGNPGIVAVHGGMRYLFPSDEQRQMFLSNPEKYAVKSAATSQTSSRKSTDKLFAIQGTSGCAGCDHGVVPIGSPDELGLAVRGKDGSVFVVEDAHKLYPKVYRDRFEGLSLRVTGKIIKREGKIAWIQPASLQVDR